VWITTLETAWYSDANTKLGFGTRLAWQPFWRLPVGFYNRFTSVTGFGAFGFSEIKDNGYYDPRQYLSFFQDLTLEMRFHPRLRAEISGRIALERDTTSDWYTAGSGSASISWAMWRGLGLTVGGYSSQSRLTTREGYEANGYYISVDYLHWK
jgi:hypothetical protein